MSLSDWAKAGWLKPQAPARDQIAKIFGVVDRDLEDSKAALSPDGRFNIAYNAALQLCAILRPNERVEVNAFHLSGVWCVA